MEEFNIQEIEKRIGSSADEYRDFLKTLGNNYKYDANSQLRIYDKNSEARACATFDFWKERMNRYVKRGEHGIKLQRMINGQERSYFVFDVTQTEVMPGRRDNFALWQYNKDVHKDVFKNMFGYDADLEHLVNYNINYSGMLFGVEDEFEELLTNSIIYAANERLGIKNEPGQITEENLKELGRVIEEGLFEDFIKTVSRNTLNVLTKINEEIVKINKEVRRNERNRNTGREEVRSGGRNIQSAGKENAVRETGRDLRGGTDERRDADTDGKREDAPRRLQEAQQVRKNENPLLRAGRRKKPRPELDADAGGTDGPSSGDTEAGGTLQGNRGTPNDGSAGSDREAEGRRPNRMGAKAVQYSLFDRGNYSEGDNNSEIENVEDENNEFIESDEEILENQAAKSNEAASETENKELPESSEILEENAEVASKTENQSQGSQNQDTEAESEKEEKASDFVITNDIQDESLTPGQRLSNNIEAIRILKALQSEGRQATLDEQKTLAKYVGWGGLSEAFREGNIGQWKDAKEFLLENLTPEEYRKASESTLTAFYTPKAVIDGIYKGLGNLGFESGNILEPSLGIGNFIGNLPENMKGSKFFGTELDTLSAEIAKKLYPSADIQATGFEDLKVENGSFDVAVSNVPFGDFNVNDSEYGENNFMIHDYFFEKAIDKLKDGGVMAFVTSSGTLDKKDSRLRELLNEKASFLGAVRLPNNVFKGSAGTEVVSDIIFLQKGAGRTGIKFNDVKTDEKQLTYNEYFVEHPEMILGEMKEVIGPFGRKLTCAPKENFDLAKELSEAVLNIKGAYVKEGSKEINLELERIKQKNRDEIRNYSYVTKENDDTIYFFQNGDFTEPEIAEKNIDRIKSYIELVKAARNVIKVQRESGDDEVLFAAQKELNNIYDSFKEKYGILNSVTNSRVFREESSYPLMRSLEIIRKNEFIRKSDIFTKRTIKYISPVTSVDMPSDALILSVTQKGKVDLEYMQRLLYGEISAENEKNLIASLKNQIFFDPDKSEYVAADEYLSGNIREKIASARIFAAVRQPQEIKEEMENNISELNKAVPKWINASEIDAKLGATWIPPEIISKFIMEKFDAYSNVTYSENTGEWYFTEQWSPAANSTYGTDRMNGWKILDKALNFKELKIYDTKYNSVTGKDERVFNGFETMKAQQKMEILKNAFANWIFSDPDRREQLERIYNVKMNSVRNREFDGSNLTFNGINPDIKLRPHQADAVARTLFGGNTLLAHVVGAGKTYEMVASCMEGKRLGLNSKSMFVVPNHLTEQFGREFLQLYPGAEILVATKADFKKEKRKEFVSRIATGKYDAVIIGHSQFERIPMSKEYQKSYLREQIDDVSQAIIEEKRSRGTFFRETTKALERTRKSLRSKLDDLNNAPKDDTIGFEELGIDKLYVDEAHNYKNLNFYTKMRNVAGLGGTNAKKSNDLFMKCRYMDKVTDGKGIVFATGTPVSNSMSELYTMQRYLQYEGLKKNGHLFFDAWASAFGETSTAMELKPEGKGYQMKTRFSKFYNLPELMTQIKEFADIKTRDMLSLPTPDVDYKKIVTEPTGNQKQILESLSERAEKVRQGLVDPWEDNMLKITTAGKQLALDQRIINPMLPDDPDSKVNQCVSNLYEIWKKTKAKKSTQLLFCDMSTPSGKNAKDFNVYDDIRKKLIERGIPKEEIEFVHNANTEVKKDKLFEKVRNGDVRILMGSTQMMGTGTNVQDKLCALHDLDVPWKPSELEQRAGRIIRQGNENEDVSVYRYITKNTFDAYLWQTIENKQKFISQVMTSREPVRSMEESDEALSYAELKALATGNPLIKEKMDLEIQVSRLTMLEKAFKDNFYRIQNDIRNIPKKIENFEEKKAQAIADLEILKNNPRPAKEKDDAVKKDAKLEEGISASQENAGPKFSITLKGKEFSDRKLAGEELLRLVRISSSSDEKIGEYRGFDVHCYYDSHFNKFEGYFKSEGGTQRYYMEFGLNAQGNFTRMDNALDTKIERAIEVAEDQIFKYKKTYEQAQKDVAKKFDKEDELSEKLARLREVNYLITNSKNIEKAAESEKNDTFQEEYASENNNNIAEDESEGNEYVSKEEYGHEGYEEQISYSASENKENVNKKR